MNRVEDGARGALGGLRVVDFSRQIAGPLCGMLLSDLGADVIKVEQPGRGDDARRLSPVNGGMSSVFVSNNRNKRSIEIDLKNPAGVEVARDLVAHADVVIENFSRGVMDRLGLGYAALSAVNPRLVYCSVTAFGDGGRFAGRPGFDPVAQADSGLFSLNGDPDRPPARVASPIVDVGSGLTALIAIQAALLSRVATGKGQHVESALFDTGIALTSYHAMTYLMTGEDPVRTGNRSVVGAPSGLFTASDGDFFLSCATDGMFRTLSKIVGQPDLHARPEFASNAVRVVNQDALYALLDAVFATAPRDHWTALLLDNGIPAGSVRSVGEALRSEEAQDRGIVSSVVHPEAGPLPNIAPPFRLNGTPVRAPRPAPQLGEHSGEILRQDLGYDEARIAALREAGAFADAARPA